VFRFFLSRGIYRWKGSVRRWTRWPHPLVVQARARLHRPRVWLDPIPLHLIFGLHDALGKIGGSAFVSSNSKNISYVAFLKHKNSKK
jgi:hypothetical protein